MTPCREWQRGVGGNGYGYKWDRELKKTVRVHRWVVAQIHGWEAIEGKVVMHLCDNRLCYRYDHLAIGTVADNSRDMTDKGRHHNTLKTHCKRGHEFDEANTYMQDGRRQCRACHTQRKKEKQ